MIAEDIIYMEKLAKRLAEALYYNTLDAIGIDGSISTGLRHDDYDFLRRIAKSEKINNLKAEIAELEKS